MFHFSLAACSISGNKSSWMYFGFLGPKVFRIISRYLASCLVGTNRRSVTPLFAVLDNLERWALLHTSVKLPLGISYSLTRTNSFC